MIIEAGIYVFTLASFFVSVPTTIKVISALHFIVGSGIGFFLSQNDFTPIESSIVGSTWLLWTFLLLFVAP